MIWLLGLFAILVAVIVIWAMLREATGRGGEQEGDAAEMASQVIAQSAAFRVDRSQDHAGWDGVERLKGIQGNDSGMGGG
ncbi:MAG: hypothetical protein JJE47_02540 [Acidimicrobiia bacterium]|nr:hypothetical protein [Acidimicrobiia bacterium]